MVRNNVIYPMYYKEGLGDTKPFTKARYLWQLHQWKTWWRVAKDTKNYSMMDQLDRQFELIGLP